MQLWRFEASWRMIYLEGYFIAYADEVQEVIGKKAVDPAEVFFTLREEYFEFLTDDPHFINQARRYGLVPSGYNPLDYIEE